MLQLVDFFREPTTYSLILHPAAEMTLEEYLSVPLRIQKHNVKEWFGCLASAAAHLHSGEVNVCHLNINLSNILVHGGRVVLAGFSLSEFSHSKSYAARSTSTYTADDKAIDVYALGCVYLEMLTVLGGFSVHSHEKIRKFIENGSRRIYEYKGVYTSFLWLRILNIRFRRLTLDVKDVVFFRNVLQVCKLMLPPNPCLRPSARDICEVCTSSTCCSTGSIPASTGLETLMQRLAHEKPKYRDLVAGVWNSPLKTDKIAGRPKPKERFLNIGDWAQDVEPGEPIIKYSDYEDEDSDSSTLVDATSHQLPPGMLLPCSGFIRCELMMRRYKISCRAKGLHLAGVTP